MVLPKNHDFPADKDVLALKETFLVQLKTVDIRSGELTGTLAKMLSSQEGVDTAMSLQGEDALSLIDILDHVSWGR